MQVHRLLLLATTLFVFTLISTRLAKAGGGAFETNPEQGTHYVGDEVQVEVVFYESDHITPRPNNNVEIRIQNPKSGDKCYMTSPVTNAEGKAYGKCTSTSVGSIYVYPYWAEGSTAGSGSLIYFFEPANTPTPIPKPVATAVASPKSTTPPAPPADSELSLPTPATNEASLEIPTENLSITQPVKQSFWQKLWSFLSNLFKRKF